MSDIEKVKAKIRALMSKTSDRGCSEHEAQSAMTKAGELLSQYDLSITEIDIKESNCITVIYDCKSKHMPIWTKYCLGSMAEFCSLKCWYAKDFNKNIIIKFFGIPEDCYMSIFLCNLINNSIQKEVLEFKNSETFLESKRFGYPCKTLTNSFQQGMSTRLSQKLRELSNQRKNPVEKVSNNSLMVIKNENIKKAKRLTVTIKNSESYNTGRKMAEKVNLNRPLVYNT